MSRTKGIGLDRRVDLEWLDVVAAQVAAGQDIAATRTKLFETLDGKVSGGPKNGSACYKTVSILSRIWSNVPVDMMPFRDHAIGALPSLSPRERLALHWAMLMAGFPFFSDVAQNTGRLLLLQGSLTLSQLTRRMRESWGDRSTMNRATQRVVRSMVQWGALADTKDKGVYVQSSKQIAVHGALADLLLEGLLKHEAKAITVDQATRHPALFPFDISLRVHDLRQSPRFEIHRQGLDVDVVGLIAQQGR